MNNSPVKSELYVALEMVELTQFLPFVYAVSICHKISHQDCHDLSSKIA